MSKFLELLAERVLLCDGATGSLVQAMDLDITKDYRGQENCTEVLNLSRPDLVRQIHHAYLAAGADLIQTNSFGGSPITLAEFELADEAHEINRLAGELAREALESFAGDGRVRFVLGSIGPGTKLPSLGHIGYDELEAALTVQAKGLIAGGVDAILIETCQDLAIRPGNVSYLSRTCFHGRLNGYRVFPGLRVGVFKIFVVLSFLWYYGDVVSLIGRSFPIDADLASSNSFL